MPDNEIRLGIIGLGYVGLPLAVEFGKYMPTLGYDLNNERVNKLIDFEDETNEISKKDFQDSKYLKFSSKEDDLTNQNVYVVTVPTPIDSDKRPDLSFLISASKTVGKYLKKGDTVIYESTVYPGATEEICLPLLEKISHLSVNNDFHLGYSPERINPGDKNHRLVNILKVTSGSNQEAADFIEQLYSKIISAGVYSADSIKIAEAAKVIENTQRDLNIALINELSVIFNRLDIDTEKVLKAAETKWNFLPFRPGLVGGHCIGVDPYYLTYKAETVGYKPQVILSGRKINDLMGAMVADNLVDAFQAKGIDLKKSKVLVLGICFKENCPDIRNTKVVDVIEKLASYGIDVDIHDPWASKKQVKSEYGYDLIQTIGSDYDGIILAVAHDQYKKMSADEIKSFGKKNAVLYDLKFILDARESDLRL